MEPIIGTCLHESACAFATAILNYLK